MKPSPQHFDKPHQNRDKMWSMLHFYNRVLLRNTEMDYFFFKALVLQQSLQVLPEITNIICWARGGFKNKQTLTHPPTYLYLPIYAGYKLRKHSVPSLFKKYILKLSKFKCSEDTSYMIMF